MTLSLRSLTAGGLLVDDNTVRARALRDANALIMLRRVVFSFERKPIDCKKIAVNWLLSWSEASNLGQDKTLVEAVAKRREQALARLREQGLAHRRVTVHPTWHLVVGIGENPSPYEIGIALHGTYGWPVIRGSTLKGLTHAWAQQIDVALEQIEMLFGSPRVGARDADAEAAQVADEPAAARRGTLRFLDALPSDKPVKVARDVLTPHVQPYYADVTDLTPPAEYHNPVPVGFLVVVQNSFAVDILAENDSDAEQAAAWCLAACENLGVGGKTAAGYGYLEQDGGDGRSDARRDS